MTTSVVTNNGRAFVTSNSSQGLQVNVAGAVFGGQIISSDIPTLESYSTMPNEVYRSSNTSLISYSQIDDNNVRFRVRLGNDIGTFNIGAHGLLLSDGTLLTLASLDATELKSQAVTGGSGGNIRFYETILNLSSVANIINLSILLTDDASLPEVATENQLPDPNSSPFPVYFVHQWLAYRKEAALASRYNGIWNFYPCFDNGLKQEFAANVVPGDAVYFDTGTDLFTRAVYNDVVRAPVGLCGENYNLVRNGGLYQAANASYQPGQNYYIDPNNPGKLVTGFNSFHVGYAITSTLFAVNNMPDTYKTVNNELRVYSDASYPKTALTLYKSDGPADGKIWAMASTTAAFTISAYNDNYSNGSDFFTVTRTGYAIKSVTLTAPSSTLSMTNSAMRYDVPNAALIMGAYSAQLMTSNSGVQATNGYLNLFAFASKFTLSNNVLSYNNDYGNIFNIVNNIAVLNSQGASLTVQPSQSFMQAGPFNGYTYACVINSNGASLQTITGPYYYFQLNSGGIISNLPISTSGQFTSAVQSDGSTVINNARSAPTLLSEFVSRPSANGYQRMPSGIIFQWGVGQTATGHLDVIYFPISFLNQAFSVVVNEGAVGGWRDDNGVGYPTIFGVAIANAGAFYLSCIRVDSGEGGSTIYQGNITYNYLAVGY